MLRQLNRQGRRLLLAMMMLLMTTGTASAEVMNQTIACGVYNSVFPELDASVIIGAWLIFIGSILFAVLNTFTNVINVGRGAMYTILAVGALLFLYANGITILETIANYSDGSINIATTINGC